MITRNAFIKRSLLSAAALLIPLRAEEKPGKIFLSKFYIAGFQYYKGNSVFKKLKINDRLIIKHEPENSYDHRALEIYTASWKKLGYVPKSENSIPSRLLRQNVKLSGVIEGIAYDEDDWRKVKVCLYINMD